MRRRTTWILTPLLLSLLSAGAFSENQLTSALINQALDRNYNLDLKDITVQDFVNHIKKDTGLPLRVDPAVWDLLPWGQQTSFAVHISNQPLRQSLNAITRSLGLTYIVQEESVELRPLPALKRLGKRATETELQALNVLASTPLGFSGDRITVQQLLSEVDGKLLALKSPFAIENRAGDALKSDQVLPVMRNASLADALDSLLVSTPATWYPWGKSIVIVTKADQIRTQLQSKTISIRYNGVDVAQVLMELQQRAGVDFDLQPGVLQSVPAEFRTIRLIFDNVSIKQALDSLAGFTGLAWTINEKGVYIWNQQSQSTTTREPILGILQLDNGMQILVPKSQIPADVQEYLQSRTEREIAKIRQMMKEEGFKPSTPATHPSASAPTVEDERL